MSSDAVLFIYEKKKSWTVVKMLYLIYSHNAPMNYVNVAQQQSAGKQS